ncbi:hypothetical protein MTF69_19195 [Streptomyces sp. AP-93]|nr:hypothetical protein [Streptomyces sp. AP-93]MCJ0871458.1 hypothetical protein [Streptomyces sp. AP-93]
MSQTTAGGLLLCRADPLAARPAAHILRERLLLAPAGEWSVLVPEAKPWIGGAESVAEVLAGWGAAVALSSNWPVLSLWWEEGRTGFVLSSGFRRSAAYAWDAAGRPHGEPYAAYAPDTDAMRTLAARLGLDPVLDLEELERLTRPDAAADGESRLLGVIALLARAGLALPAGLNPGEPADRLREAARVAPAAERVEWAGWRDTVRAELAVVEDSPLGPWLRGPKARLAGAAQLAAGAPLMMWAARRRSPGWLAAGTVLVTHGAAALAYDRARRRA